MSNNSNPMSSGSVYDIITMIQLGVSEEWFEDARRPLDPLIFALNEEAARRVFFALYPPTPLPVEEMAQQKPMSYYIALEQDKLHAKEHGEVAVLSVRD